ncbi:kunitz-type serine protease inhibitor A [Anabrus simplex]|uniref:kunitz-type serine protease inhibitor A n=1 Tax=Anabrus simplex TaxID=316456 RepID=UPI0035A3122D
MAFYKLLLLASVITLAWAASKRPQYFDAIVVDAEGRSDDSSEEPTPTVQLSDCLLPMSRGPCRAYFPAYYYNPTSDKCDKFTYSGCGGNNNRFSSLKLCEQSCKDARKLLNVEDQCADRKPVCSKGCFLVNDFKDCPRCECSAKVRQAMCSQPPVRGHCRALLPRWRYDVETKTCTEFKFGGCDGNGNNFISEQECLNACEGV